MQLFLNKPEAECLLDALKGQMVKSQFKRRDDIIKQIEDRLCRGPIRNPNGFTPGIKNGRVAPLRGSWPQNVSSGGRKSNWSYKKPRDKKPKTEKEVKPQPTAEEILASI